MPVINKVLYLLLVLALLFLGHGYLTSLIVRTSWTRPFPIEEDYLLTFDDGPSRLSPELLDLLEDQDKKAIFFLLGKNLKDFDPSIYEDQVLACHGYDHVNFALMGPRRTRKEFTKALDAFKEKGIKPKYFRAPYGLYNLTLVYLIHKNGMEVFHWDYLLGDWVLGQDGDVYKKLKDLAKDKNTLVLHDGTEGKADKGAKDQMIKELERFLNEEEKEKENSN